MAYIQSQRHERWRCLPARYDDGGFTGGNMDRPALKRLLADIEASRIDCVVSGSTDPAALRREKDEVRILSDGWMTKRSEGAEWVVLRVNH